MKKHLTIIFSAAMCMNTFAQNLIPNPGFESPTNCPSGENMLSEAAPWVNPTAASPDCFNTCGSGGVGIPANNFGDQNARTGSGYAGFFAYHGSMADYREYIQVALTSPLIANTVYCFSMYVNLSDESQYGVNSLGVYFSAAAVSSSGTSTLAYTPQVVKPSSFITDTANWVLYNYEYTAAGGESYITIGNFYLDASTPLLPAGVSQNYSYYYIDDLNLEEMFTVNATASSGPNFVCPGDMVTLTATTSASNASYLWAPGGQQTDIANVYPTANTTYTVTVSNGICDNTATVSVNVSTMTPTVTASTDTLCAPNDTVMVSASGSGFTGFWWADAASPSDTLGTGGSVTLQPQATITCQVTCLDAFGCTKTASTTVIDNRPVIDIGADTTIFIGDSLILDAGNVGATYAWSTTETTQQITVKTAGTYTVTVTDTTSLCSDIDTVTVQAIQGIADKGKDFHMAIYPNPSSGNMNLALGSNFFQNHQGVRFIVYDLTGRRVKEFGISSPSSTLTLSNLEKGFYCFKLADSKGFIASGNLLLN